MPAVSQGGGTVRYPPAVAKGPTLKVGPIEISVPSFGGLITSKGSKAPLLEQILRELGKLLK
jgi:hypothetical protein